LLIGSASEVTTLWHYTNLFIIIIFYLGTQFPGHEKITLCNTNKYKNQAGMNLVPPTHSQNSHAVRWHCIAELEQRVTKIKI